MLMSGVGGLGGRITALIGGIELPNAWKEAESDEWGGEITSSAMNSMVGDCLQLMLGWPAAGDWYDVPKPMVVRVTRLK